MWAIAITQKLKEMLLFHCSKPMINKEAAPIWQKNEVTMYVLILLPSH